MERMFAAAQMDLMQKSRKEVIEVLRWALKPSGNVAPHGLGEFVGDALDALQAACRYVLLILDVCKK